MKDAKFRPFASAVFTAMPLAALFLFAASIVPSSSFAQQNLLLNGDLAEAVGNSPRYWYDDAWVVEPAGVTFDWLADNQPPELEVWNHDPADARWIQALHLEPGWYHVAGSARTEDVGSGAAMGANLSILGSWIASQQVQGTADWRTVGFYVKVAEPGADVLLTCRLGFYSSLNTGKAFFRNLSVTKVDAPASGGDQAFDLAEDRAVSTP